MFHGAPLLLFLALASAVPKDHFQRQRIFGLPTEIVSNNLEDSDETEVSMAGASGERTSASEEHLTLGATEESAFFRKFLGALRPETDGSWNVAQETTLLGEQEKESSAHSKGKFEETAFPDIKIVKYELPALPELKPFDVPVLPDIELPEVKILKYELPPVPELPPMQLAPYPEFNLPDWKIVKYELPSFPELQFTELPSLEFSFPDWRIVKYELPLPEVQFPELPEPLPLELPAIKIQKYELPDWDIQPVDVSPFPEMNMPVIKIIKYELPSVPEIEDILPLPDVTSPEVKSELQTTPEIKQRKTDLSMTSSSEAELQQNLPSNLRTFTESVPEEQETKQDLVLAEQFPFVREDVVAETLVSADQTTFVSVS